MENKSSMEWKGHRSIVICGKISRELNEAVCGLIENGKYRTKNDVVEQALIQFINSIKPEEGC